MSMTLLKLKFMRVVIDYIIMQSKTSYGQPIKPSIEAHKLIEEIDYKIEEEQFE